MAFLNKIGKAIGDAAGTATEKAKDFAETTKLNNAISAEEKQINQLFMEIGKQVFMEEKNNPDSPFAEIIGKIAESFKKIEELKNKIQEIKLD
jgi:conjugal transfer/entry exclusion protein